MVLISFFACFHTILVAFRSGTLGSAFGAVVTITQDGPGVLNSTIYFTAQLYDDEGHKQNSDTIHKFTWADNAMPQHTYTVSEESAFK